MALIKQILQAHKPILGICRGSQILNVALGGTLYQDLTTQNQRATIKHTQASPRQYPSHHVTITTNSHLEQLLGQHVYVNSRHHQAVKQAAPSLKVVATALDGIVETVEGDNILAVQWHPKNMWLDYSEQLQSFADLVQRSQS